MKRTSVPFEKIVADLDTPSVLVKSTLSMLASSVRHGLTATAQTAHVVVAFLRRMKRAEKSLAMMLQKSLSMMRATAMTLAPVVCAIIVVLFQIITKTIKETQQQFASSGFDMFQLAMTPEVLQLIVGLYALALNYVLLRYVNRLQNGPDDIAFRADLAKALPITMVLFTFTLIASRIMLAGMA